MINKEIKLTVVVLIAVLFSSCFTERTSYNLPIFDKKSHFCYLSEEYIQYLNITKSHPESVNLVKGDYPIILFYQTNDKKYHESNLHEGGSSVEINSDNNYFVHKGKKYIRISVSSSVEKSITSVIIQNTLVNGKYITKDYLVKITNKSININNKIFSIIVDTGGGYNTLRETMIQSNYKVNGHNTFAIKQDKDCIKLIPLRYEDGPVALPDGDEIVLFREK